MKKKSIVFVLLVFMFGLFGALSFFSVPNVTEAVSIDASDWDGKSSANTDLDIFENRNSFYIRSANGFAYFANQVNKANGYQSFLGKTVYLDVDINLNSNSWTPIGNSSQYFQGTFDGQGHSIYNLKVDSPNGGYAGLFGYTNGTIQNLHIKNSNLTASGNFVGTIVGELNGGTLSECSATGEINSSENTIGGLVGNLRSATLEKCKSSISINSTSDSNVGGVVGNVLRDSNFNQVAFDGNIKVTSNNVGGIIGLATAVPNLSNSYSVGDITGGSRYIGGLIGKSDSGAFITNSYSAGRISDITGGYVSGLVGWFANRVGANITDSFSVTIDIKGEDNITVPALYNKGVGVVENLKNVYSEADYFSSTTIRDLSKLVKTKDFFANSNYWSESSWSDTVWNVTTGKNAGYPHLIMLENLGNANNDKDTKLIGEGTKENPYLIKTAGDLTWLSLNYHIKNGIKYYSLQNDIDLSGRTWIPIGQTHRNAFTGVFDGNGYSITGLTCSLHEQFSYHGLFGVTGNAVIKNLAVENVSFINGGTHSGYYGAFVGMANSNTYFINCKLEIQDDKPEIQAVGNINGTVYDIKGKNGDLNLTGVTKGFDVTVSGNGGNFYAADETLYSEYHLLLNSDGTLIQQDIDTTFGKTLLPGVSSNFGKTDVLIKRGSKLTGYIIDNTEKILEECFNKNSITVSNDIVKNGISAVWNSETNPVITIIYNQYEIRNFDATELVTQNFDVEYDSCLKDYPNLWENPQNYRDGAFDIEGLYTDEAFKTKVDKENTAFITEDATYYVKWKGLEPAKFQLMVKFEQSDDKFAGKFNLSDAFENLKLIYSNNKEVIGTLSDGYVTFEYDTTCSDMLDNYLQFNLSLKEGYSFAEPVTLNELALSEENIKKFGKLKASAESADNLEKFNEILFKNLVGKYNIVVTLQRNNLVTNLTLGEGVHFAVAPLISTNMADVEIKTNAGQWLGLTSVIGAHEGVYVGLDFINKELLTSSKTFDATAIASYFINNQVNIRIGGDNGRYFIYEVGQTDRFADETEASGVYDTYSLYEANKDLVKLNKLVSLTKKSDEQFEINYLANSSFSFIFSTEQNELVFENITFKDFNNDVTFTQLLPNGEGAPTKTLMTFDKLLVNEKDLQAVTAYTKAVINVKLVDKDGNEIRNNSPELSMKQTAFDVSGNGKIQFNLTASDFYVLKGSYKASDKGNGNSYDLNKVDDVVRIAVSHVSDDKDDSFKNGFNNGDYLREYFSNVTLGVNPENARVLVVKDDWNGNGYNKDSYEFTLPYKYLKAGYYEISLVCEEIDYSIGYATKFVDFNGSKTEFEDEEDSGISFDVKVPDGNYNKIKYNDEITLRTNLGDNKAYQFYGWYFKGENYTDYLKFGGSNVLDTELNYLYNDKYRRLDGNIQNENRYNTTVYAVYVKKELNLVVSDRVIVANENGGETREYNASSLGLGFDLGGTTKYSFTTSETNELSDLYFTMNGTNNAGYYLAGYRLVDAFNRQVFDVAGQEIVSYDALINQDTFDLHATLKDKMENGETSVSQTYVVVPVVKQKTATLVFYSGTGLENTFNDGRDGVVYDHNGVESTNSIFVYENAYYGMTYNLNSALLGTLNGNQESIVLDNLFATRKGYHRPNNEFWKLTLEDQIGSGDRALNGSSIYLNADLFSSFANNATINLYRVWEGNTYTITFQSNGGKFATNVSFMNVNVNYEKAGITGNLPNSTSISKTGHELVGWSYTNQNGETAKVFDVNATSVRPSELFNENGEYILAENVSVFAMWQAQTYDVAINFNSANMLNEDVIPFDGQSEYTINYQIEYGTTFANLKQGSELLSLSNLTPTREGYVFAGFYAVNGNNRTRILNSTTFDENIISCNLKNNPALTLYALWELDSNYFDLTLNKNYLSSLTYNGAEQLINVADYFTVENFTAKGFNVEIVDGELNVTLNSNLHSSVELQLSSDDVVIENSDVMQFGVRNAGNYIVKLNITVKDNSTHLNLGDVLTKTLTLSINVNKAQLSEKFGLALQLENVKKIMLPFADRITKSKLENCETFDNFVVLMKEIDNSMQNADSQEIYDFVMFKYFMLINSNETHSTYKNWKYSDFASYRQNNQETVDSALSNIKFIEFYDHNNLVAVKELEFYKDVIGVQSEEVLNASAEVGALKVVAYSNYGFAMTSKNLYDLRLYLKNVDESADFISNYEVLRDAENQPYLNIGKIFILPEILTIENQEEIKYAYFNNLLSNVEVNWAGNREFVEINNQTYFQLEDNLYLSATVLTSNNGNKDVDTEFSFTNVENYLYFSNARLLSRVASNGEFTFVDVTNEFKLVMAEDDVFTILNIKGVANITFSSKLLTRKNGALSYDSVEESLATELLRISSVTYEFLGETKTSYNANGLEVGAFLDDGVMIYQIFANNDNTVSLFINRMVKSVNVSATTKEINDYIALYKWSEYQIYSVDGTMDLSGSFELSVEDINMSEDSFTEVEYQAIFTDLVLVNYQLNFPGSYSPASMTASVLQLGVSTVDDLFLPKENGFALASLKNKTPTGNTIDYSEIFTGPNTSVDGEDKKLFVGLLSNARFAPITLEAKWNVEDIETVQVFETLKQAVQKFEGLNVSDVARISNKNDRIYTYKYDWYQGTKLISSDETLTLPNNGSFDESGVYKLVVSAILKDEFVNVSLEDKTKASSSAEIYFELDFVKNKVTNVILPSSDTLSTVYDNREHINDWSVTVEYLVYDDFADNYSEETESVTLYFTNSGEIYFDVRFNGLTGSVSSIKNAGSYDISVCFDSAIFDVEETITDYMCKFVYNVTPLHVDLSAYNFDESKHFNGVEPTLNKSVFLANENVPLAFVREEGEDIGQYKMYLSDIMKDFKGNYVFKLGDVVLFENGMLTTEGETTAVATFEITTSGALRLSYDTSIEPAALKVPYSGNGYSLNLTNDFKLQILKDGSIFKEMKLNLYDSATGMEITSNTILNILSSKVVDITPMFFDTDEKAIASNSGAYSYRFNLGTIFSNYFTNVEFETGYQFVIDKITVDVSALNFDKVYDGEQISYYQIDGTKIADISTYSGAYLTATYASTHVGTNIAVELNLLKRNSEINLSNYNLSSKSVSAQISKLKATLTVNLTKTIYTYGEISVNNIADNILSYTVVDENGLDRRSLLVNGYYEINYSLPTSIKTNERGFIYKGENYSLQAESNFVDFDMTLNLPNFAVKELIFEKEIWDGYITITTLDKIQATYDESVTISSTGDVLNLNYVVQSLTVGQVAPAGSYELSLNSNSFLDGSVVIELTPNNNGFVVLHETETIYMSIDDESIFNQTYNSQNFVLSVDAESKTVIVSNGTLTQTSSVTFYSKNESDEKINKDVTLKSFEIFNGDKITTFRNAGNYRLTLLASSEEYANVVFEKEYNFVIEKISVNSADWVVTKDYDANVNFVISTFDEKISGDDVNVVARFDNSNVGNDKVVNLFLQGKDMENYQLTNSIVSGNITKTSAVVALTQTDYTYGDITKRKEVLYSVSVAGNELLPSQYEIDFTIENEVYSDADYLEVGTYLLKMTTAISANYNFVFEDASITVSPFKLEIEFSTSGELSYEFGAPQTLTNKVSYDYLTPLYENIMLNLTRESGKEINFYRILSGEVENNKNYEIDSLEDVSQNGMFRITKTKEMIYLLLSDKDVVENSNDGSTVSIVYDGNLYDAVAVESREVGLYNLVISNSNDANIKQTFQLNAYTFDTTKNVYRKTDVLLDNLNTNIKFLNPNLVKNFGTYEIYASGTTSDNFDVRLGKANQQYCFYLQIAKQNLFFKDKTLTKVFDNKDAVLRYEDAGELLTGVIAGESIGLNVTFVKDGTIGKYADVNYSVEAEIFGEGVGNYVLNLSTEEHETLSATITRADLTFVVNSQRFIYGDAIDLKFSYLTDVDLSDYDMSRINYSLKEITTDSNYSANSGALKVGEYNILLVGNAQDFRVAGYVIDNLAQTDLTARLIIEKKDLQLEEISTPLQDVFTKKYDGTNYVQIKDNSNKYLFNLLGKVKSFENVEDVVYVDYARYLNENVGQAIQIDFTLAGEDSGNYNLDSWAYGVIESIIVQLNFDYKAEGNDVTSNVDSNGLKTLSQMAFPFLSTSYLTANSADSETNNLRNFPTSLTGKTGNYFIYWTLDFENVANGSEKLQALEAYVANANIDKSYVSFKDDTYSIRVDNDSKTVSLLNQLIKDEKDLFGVYYKNNSDISLTFNANWNVNKYRITIQIADENGKTADYGTVEVGDESNTIVSENYMKEFDYDQSLTLKASANAHCLFHGFYTSAGKLYDGSEPYISLSREGNKNVLTISNVRQSYNFVVRFASQKVNLGIDLSQYKDVSIESDKFINDGTNKYIWATDYKTLEKLTLNDLPEIDRVGFNLASYISNGITIKKENFATTKLSTLVANSQTETVSVELVPNFVAVGVAVTLDFGYNNLSKTITVAFGEKFNSSSDWVEMPIRLGHDFVGWFDSNDVKIVGENTVSGTESIRLIAKWKLGKFDLSLTVKNAVISEESVTFEKNGNVYSIEEVEYGTIITFKVSANEGYEISADWTNNFDVTINTDGTANVSLTMPANDFEYILPIVAKQNVVTLIGERLQNIDVFDITEDETKLTLNDNKFSISTGRKVRIITTAQSGYEMSDQVYFEENLGLKVSANVENGILTLEIEGINKNNSITFTTEESRNKITLNFSDNSVVSTLIVGDINYNSVANLPKFDAMTDSTFVYYVKYAHGYRFASAESQEFEVSAELQTEGAYSGFYKFEVTQINSTGSVFMTSTLAKFTLTLDVVSYDENKNRVEVSGNKAFANGQISLEVDFNTKVSLSVETAALYSFAGWSKDGVNIISSDQNLNYTVTETETLYAIFSALRFDMSLATFDHYNLNTEFNNPNLIKPVYTEISGGRYFDSETGREISNIQVYYGAIKSFIYRVPDGYKYYGVGYYEGNEFVYIDQEDKIDKEVEVTVSSLVLNENLRNFKLYVVVRSFEINLKIETKINIDGVYEENIDVGFIELQGENGSSTNRYGYVEGTRVHYNAKDFADGGVKDNKAFEVVAYTRDFVYIKVQVSKKGYRFDSVISNRSEIEIQNVFESDTYQIYRIGGLIGGTEDALITVLFKPILNQINLSFESNGYEVDGGIFSISVEDTFKNKVWTSGNEYSNIKVSAYTDSKFKVFAYVRAGFSISEDNLKISDENHLIVSESLKFEKLSIVDTGYTARLSFEVAGYLEENNISIEVMPSVYTVRFVEDSTLLATIKNVSFNSTLNLSEENSSNISIFDERITYVNGNLNLIFKQDNYNYEGFFTYQNGAGVRYINSNGEVVNLWKESGYELNTLTSKYQLTENAKINEQTGEIEITLYLYWSYLKTRISFQLVPNISTNYTAQDMVEGVDHTNSWYYSSAPLYIEVSYNTDIHLIAPEIVGYKFYKFVISQKNARGEWLSDVVAYSNNIPWSTNELDNIVECNIQVVYFAEVEVNIFGGDAKYLIHQEVDDTQARVLLQEGFVDTTKEFTIEAVEEEGYRFLRWLNTTTGQTSFAKNYTLITNRRISLIMNLQGAEVVISFKNESGNLYDFTHGKIMSIKTESRDNSVNTFTVGSYIGNEFNQTMTEVGVKVGDKVTLALVVDYGFGVNWNRNDITYKEYRSGLTYFTLEISSDNSGKTLRLIPQFMDEIVSVYILRDFVETDKIENALDLNNVALAGYATYQGRRTDFVSVAKGQEIEIKTITNSRYLIESIVLSNYDRIFVDMENFFDGEKITLTNEYMEANNIVGAVQIKINYKRALWESELLEEAPFGGAGSEGNPYKIACLEDLILMMKYVNSGKFAPNGIRYKDSAFVLLADIDLIEKFWTPIGTEENKFNGYFNFNDHKVSGIYHAFMFETVSYDGLFGVLGDNARIVLNKTSLWYIYLIIAILILLIILIIVLLLVARKRKLRREQLAKT